MPPFVTVRLPSSISPVVHVPALKPERGLDESPTTEQLFPRQAINTFKISIDSFAVVANLGRSFAQPYGNALDNVH